MRILLRKTLSLALVYFQLVPALPAAANPPSAGPQQDRVLPLDYSPLESPAAPPNYFGRSPAPKPQGRRASESVAGPPLTVSSIANTPVSKVPSIVASALVLPNQPPVANAGADQTVGCAGPSHPNVVLNAGSSSDPEAQALTYEWRDGTGTVVATAVTVALTRKVGSYTFTLKVTDSEGAWSTDSVTVIVQAECDGTTVTVDEAVSVDFNTTVPTCSDGTTSDLCQYFSYDKSGGSSPSQWKAIFDLGAKQLVVLNGATVQTNRVPASGDFRETPGLEIRSKCNITVQAGGVVSLAPANADAGNIHIQADGGLTVNGSVRNEVDGTVGAPGKVTLVSCCGDVNLGSTSRVETKGIDEGGSDIQIVACCGGDVSISGAVTARHNSGTAPKIQVVSFHGRVSIDANTDFGEENFGNSVYRRTSGLLVFSIDQPPLGKIEVQARQDVTLLGNRQIAWWRDQTSALHVAPYSVNTSSEAGHIRVVSLEGKALLWDQSARFATRYNGNNQVKFEAKGNVEAAVTTSVNDGAPDNSKVVVSAFGAQPAGNITMRSYSGSVSIGQNAKVWAKMEGGGQPGSMTLTACTGTTVTGSIQPADSNTADDSGTCQPPAPTPIFESCSDLGIQCVPGTLTNQPPAVNAGPDKNTTLPNDTVTLNGTATDDGLPMGSTLSVQWSKVSGPGNVAFSQPNSASTNATFSVVGNYVLELRASDSMLTSTDTVLVSVANGNVAPVVSAGPDRSISLPTTSLTLQGSVSDDALPTGAPLNVQWIQLNPGPTATISSPTQAVTQVTLPAVGQYVFRLSAGDTQFTTSDDVTVTQVDFNAPPIVNAGGSQTVTLPTNTASLNGSASDDNRPPGGALSFDWSVIYKPAGGKVTFNQSTSLSTQVTFEHETPGEPTPTGTYILRLSAFDTELRGASDTQVIVAASQNNAPVVSAGPDQVITFPNQLTLNGTATDTDGPATLSVAWSKVSGPGVVSFANANLVSTTATFSEIGAYVLRLTATDSAISVSDDISVYAGQLDCVTSNKGTDFWLAIPRGAVGNIDPVPDLYLLVSSDVTTTATITAPGLGTIVQSIPLGGVVRVDLPTSLEVATADGIEVK